MTHQDMYHTTKIEGQPLKREVNTLVQQQYTSLQGLPHNIRATLTLKRNVWLDLSVTLLKYTES